MTVFQKNTVTPEFTLQCCDDVKEICTPLFKNFPITYFFHVKHFFDGSMAALSPNREFLLNEISYDNWSETNVSQYFDFKRDDYVFVAEQHRLLPESSQKKYVRLLKIEQLKYDATNAFCIKKVIPGGFEGFYFLISTSHSEGYQFYLNNLENLERFVLYFKDKAQELMQKAEQNKIVVPHKKIIIPEDKKIQSFTLPELDREDFMKATALSNNTLLVDGQAVSISERERECADLLLQGFRCKEIAKKLYLSPRTIESHLETLKEKTDSNNQSRLIQLLHANKVGQP